MARKKKEIVVPPPCSSVREYEQSDWWKAKSKELLERKDAVCAICGRSRWRYLKTKNIFKRDLRFAVHHISYLNVPHENESDFLVLCNCCHTICHDILRYKNISPFYEELSNVVLKYFTYDVGSAGKNNYLNGVNKNENNRG